MLAELERRGMPTELALLPIRVDAETDTYAWSTSLRLAERLQVSTEEASRRLTDAADLGPRTAVTGEALAPVLPHFAAAQAHGQVGAEHLRITRKFFKKLPAAVDRATRAAAEKDLAQRAATVKDRTGVDPKYCTASMVPGCTPEAPNALRSRNCVPSCVP